MIRYALLKSIARKCGDNVSIHPDCYIFHLENIAFGNNVSIHPMCYIDGIGGITIGNDVSIAHGATILSSSHQYGDIHIPIKDQGMFYKETIIENNVWIGAKCSILYGTTVAEGSIVAANSLVNKSYQPFSIIGGVPAKTIKSRIN